MRLLLILCPIFCLPAFADELEQTESLLRMQLERNQFIEKDSKAKTVDAYAAKVAGSKENKDQMYNIAASITRSLAESSNGDVSQMKAKLETAMKNPEKFLESLTPQQREQIHSLATKIESEKPTGPAKP